MIHFSNVTFRYGMSSRGDVLSNVSLHLKPGFIYGLLGKNGVGKSTLIRLISGLNPASQGSVRTLGQKPQLRLPSMLQEIFIIPEEMTFPPITPAKYGEIYGTFYPRFNAGDMMKYLDTLQVDPRQTMSTMSQGQR
ncbi:MAG: ATP-binding cassette domain-containing protein, partial [Proteobacteria bacterium]|nr:ATP-binding cassette domain-containing protein [Pseudomonadota bacterium]